MSDARLLANALVDDVDSLVKYIEQSQKLQDLLNNQNKILEAQSLQILEYRKRLGKKESRIIVPGGLH